MQIIEQIGVEKLELLNVKTVKMFSLPEKRWFKLIFQLFPCSCSSKHILKCYLSSFSFR